MLAIEAGLPIVPVSVEGTRHVMQKGRLMTCPGHVRVRVLRAGVDGGLRDQRRRVNWPA